MTSILNDWHKVLYDLVPYNPVCLVHQKVAAAVAALQKVAALTPLQKAVRHLAVQAQRVAAVHQRVVAFRAALLQQAAVAVAP